MERQIDFWRDRNMLCGNCAHRFVVSLKWIDRWEKGDERCPGCGIGCQDKDGPEVDADRADPALDGGRIAEYFWYHTSTHSDWPSDDYNPAAGLLPDWRDVMGGDRLADKWVAGQRAKALHIGTYEAAVHNMLRRMADQDDSQNRFYLYRVHLRPDIIVREDCLVDPGNFLGDVPLADVCPQGIDATRYINRHEDPSSLSLALGRNAIDSIQQVALPVTGIGPRGWARDAAAVLEALSDEPVMAKDILGHDRPGPSERAGVAWELGDELADLLPDNLREEFESAVRRMSASEPLAWAAQLAGLVGLIEEPHSVLAALNSEVPRKI